MNGMYLRDSKLAFESAKSKGLTQPQDYMYMYSKDNKDFFKNIMDRKHPCFLEYLTLAEVCPVRNLRNHIVDYKVFKKYIQCNIEHELFQKFM